MDTQWHSMASLGLLGLETICFSYIIFLKDSYFISTIGAELGVPCIKDLEGAIYLTKGVICHFLALLQFF